MYIGMPLISYATVIKLYVHLQLQQKINFKLRKTCLVTNLFAYFSYMNKSNVFCKHDF